MHQLEIKVLDIVDARCNHDIVDARCNHEVYTYHSLHSIIDNLRNNIESLIKTVSVHLSQTDAALL